MSLIRPRGSSSTTIEACSCYRDLRNHFTSHPLTESTSTCRQQIIFLRSAKCHLFSLLIACKRLQRARVSHKCENILGNSLYMNLSSWFTSWHSYRNIKLQCMRDKARERKIPTHLILTVEMRSILKYAKCKTYTVCILMQFNVHLMQLSFLSHCSRQVHCLLNETSIDRRVRCRRACSGRNYSSVVSFNSRKSLSFATAICWRK